jgi:hypothetical protein
MAASGALLRGAGNSPNSNVARLSGQKHENRGMGQKAAFHIGPLVGEVSPTGVFFVSH